MIRTHRAVAVLAMVLGLALFGATGAAAQELPDLPIDPGDLPFDPGDLPLDPEDLPGLPGGEESGCVPDQDGAILVCTFETPAESPVQGKIVITISETGVQVEVTGGSDGGDDPEVPALPLPDLPLPLGLSLL